MVCAERLKLRLELVDHLILMGLPENQIVPYLSFTHVDIGECGSND